MGTFLTKTVLIRDEKLLEKAFQLRREVFVREQNVPIEIERDEDDAVAFHVAVLSDDGAGGTDDSVPPRQDAGSGGELVGTGRLVIRGNKGKIGRMAVKSGLRGKGIGKILLDKLIEIGKENGVSRFYLHAQITAKDFYLKLGFVQVGDLFEEAGIVHQRMELP